MSCVVHDYEYIRTHLEEYQYTMALVRKEAEKLYGNFHIDCPPDVYERGIEIAFYKCLLDTGEMSSPNRCWGCPFHSVRFNALSQMCDECDINIVTYVGNQFFASSKEKPEWCPLIKEVQT